VQGRHPLQTSEALGAAAAQLGPDAQAAVVELNKQSGLSHGKVTRWTEAVRPGRGNNPAVSTGLYKNRRGILVAGSDGVAGKRPADGRPRHRPALGKWTPRLIPPLAANDAMAGRSS
jgi:hypothetical protein